MASAIAALAPAAPAGAAAFGPGAVPVSATNCALGAEGTAELGTNVSGQPVMSDDGRYVVFATSAQNLLGRPTQAGQYFSSGIFRCDTQTGTLALVAPPGRNRSDGDSNPNNDQVVQAPPSGASISADGRRVAFTTAQQLLPTDQNLSDDVYVRDMTRSLSDAARAYELASAADGADQAPVYQRPAEGSRTGRAALSDDGRRVAFVTRSASNIGGGNALSVPGDQVFVRDLDTRRTVRITARRDTGAPVPESSDPNEDPQQIALSGDGGTVAWVGSSVSEQTLVLRGERVPPTDLLWRAVAGGPTRRVSGAADVDDPACDLTATYVDSGTQTGPCYGPLRSAVTRDSGGGIGSAAGVALSDDGRAVSFQSSANLRGTNDLRTAETFVADMSPGVTRKQGTRRVLSYPSGEDGATLVAFAGTGRHMAVATRSRVFPELRALEPMPVAPASLVTSLYLVDLVTRTVELVTRSPDGGAYAQPGFTTDPGIGQSAISDDGTALAFSTQLDGNLFLGDANTAPDVLLVRRAADIPGSVVLPPPPPLPPASDAVLTATPVRPLTPAVPVFGALRIAKDGAATLRVRTPGPGRLTATARGVRGKRKVTVGTDKERAKKAQTIVLRVVPRRSATALLRRKPYRVKVTLTATYKPASGPTARIRRTYELAGRRAKAPATRKTTR